LNEIFDLILVYNITMNNVGTPVSANGFRYLFAQLVLDISYHHHACTLFGKEMCRLFADAAGTSGNDGYFVG
jgi:hypothetical protein